MLEPAGGPQSDHFCSQEFNDWSTGSENLLRRWISKSPVRKSVAFIWRVWLISTHRRGSGICSNVWELIVFFECRLLDSNRSYWLCWLLYGTLLTDRQFPGKQFIPVILWDMIHLFATHQNASLQVSKLHAINSIYGSALFFEKIPGIHSDLVKDLTAILMVDIDLIDVCLIWRFEALAYQDSPSVLTWLNTWILLLIYFCIIRDILSE